ncbi:hypothetical protein C3K47_15665 [Solitalea longa]|uniref:Uncharacterized protein n=1 Tax=Solitalea longa TaxID=2079460 RepID=A0A2S4ZYR9_9SPHI|nr:hypothetical protein [Solitalea longa]POY35495.1 hypothetical protein C3K47_15665 [Solitalea longa]
MTFIASVIAKDGVAMVADSFVTTIEHSIDKDDFIDYLSKTKSKTTIPITDLINLFQRRASHTRNYADKLFQFDDYSAIATAGSAYINGVEIKDIVKKIAAEMQIDKSVYYSRDIEDILKEFCNYIKKDVLEHLTKYDCGETDFIFSHFNRAADLPQIFLIRIKSQTKDNHDPNDTDIVTYSDRTHLKILTDGQDGFVDRLIFGSLYTNTLEIKNHFIDYILKTFKPKAEKRKEIIEAINDFEFIRDIVTKDFFSLKFRELSLQEAVNLAALLIKIIMDIQVYTEKIPTVGGLIRLAVIQKETGFQWISGDKILPSKII